MAHAVESMMFVGETPWHGLGVKVDKAPSVTAAIEASGLGWDVKLQDLYAKLPRNKNKGARDSVMVDHKAVVRCTDEEVLGVVGPAYRPLQNREAFSWFDPLLEAGDAELHTAGSLMGGKRVWVLAKIMKGSMEIAKDDLVEKFVLLSNGHDGLMSVRVGFTPIRVVCANTLAIAHAKNVSKLVRVIHNTHVSRNLKDLRETINVANETFEATADQYRRLAKCGVNKSDMRKYVKVVLGFQEDEEVKTITEKTIDTILSFASSGRGNDGKTMWDAYNGVTEYLSYARGKDQNHRINGLWFGTAAATNERALEIAIQLAS